MTKEIAEKHGSIIKWFCDNADRGVWQQVSGFTLWELTYKPYFDLGFNYVKNDEYAEYRKALTDGKTIQFLRVLLYPSGCTNYMNHSLWLDWNSYGECFCSSDSYRIKPDEPKFKVGDWVKLTTSSSVENQGRIIKITDIRDSGWFTGEGTYENEFKLSCVELWKPQPGEWCWYGFELVQVIGINSLKICRQQSDAYEELDDDILQPFIGALPTIVEDK